MAKTTSIVDQIKEILGDAAARIILHDLVIAKTRNTISALEEYQAPAHERWSAEELQRQLVWFETKTCELRSMLSVLAYWGEPYHGRTLALPLIRVAEHMGGVSSERRRHLLEWYPVLLAAYCVGISAEAAGRYENLANVLHAKVISSVSCF